MDCRNRSDRPGRRVLEWMHVILCLWCCLDLIPPPSLALLAAAGVQEHELQTPPPVLVLCFESWMQSLFCAVMLQKMHRQAVATGAALLTSIKHKRGSERRGAKKSRRDAPNSPNKRKALLGLHMAWPDVMGLASYNPPACGKATYPCNSDMSLALAIE
ncbi:hypothetical protein OPV22_012762 [Ensete ventricosum]|uniref:Uncharacterized protein n=1 Tax=Ensete ventricosum TaxID=4639 RepID=A0AAV8R889_ENSVE|nr:hypothetical protein OPV22_012762 [Ensete ventricosum]